MRESKKHHVVFLEIVEMWNIDFFFFRLSTKNRGCRRALCPWMQHFPRTVNVRFVVEAFGRLRRLREQPCHTCHAVCKAEAAHDPKRYCTPHPSPLLLLSHVDVFFNAVSNQQPRHALHAWRAIPYTKQQSTRENKYYILRGLS